VIQDHLRFFRVLALSCLTEFDEPLCVQARVCVAFQATRGPGEVNQEARENVARERASSAAAVDWSPDLVQMSLGRPRQVCRAIRYVKVEEAMLVSNRLSTARRPRDVAENLASSC